MGELDMMILNKNDNTNTPLTSCKIQKISSTYSNTKIPIYKLIIDNKPISRNNSYSSSDNCTCSNDFLSIDCRQYQSKFY